MPGRPDYLTSLAENLYLGRLRETTRGEFEKADGAELNDGGSRPAKMKSVLSSSALAVNFFDAWREGSSERLTAALRLREPIMTIHFEHMCSNYPVGPRRPNLDVFLVLGDGTRVGIECKFLEPYHSPREHWEISPRYFTSDGGFWAQAGLRAAQALADRMRGEWYFLDAAQLLKHMLGLASEQHQSPRELVYLWFDTGLQDATGHKEEALRFQELVEGDAVGFRVLSYQDLFVALAGAGPVGEEQWHGWMAGRYFG